MQFADEAASVKTAVAEKPRPNSTTTTFTEPTTCSDKQITSRRGDLRQFRTKSTATGANKQQQATIHLECIYVDKNPVTGKKSACCRATFFIMPYPTFWSPCLSLARFELQQPLDGLVSDERWGRGQDRGGRKEVRDEHVKDKEER